jgi:hypothetical protein
VKCVRRDMVEPGRHAEAPALPRAAKLPEAEREKRRRAAWAHNQRRSGRDPTARPEDAPPRRRGLAHCPRCQGRRWTLKRAPHLKRGLQRVCMDCVAAASLAYRHRNLEEVRRRDREGWKRRSVQRILAELAAEDAAERRAG